MARILIIGGGVAGLSAGIHALRKGHRVIICEKHTVAGGNLTGWQRGEYHIDNCIHWLTGTNPSSDLYSLWKDLDMLGSVDVYQGKSLYTCEANGETLSLLRDIDALEKRMTEISPQDKKPIEEFIKDVKTFQHFCGVGGKDHNEKMTTTQKAKSLPTFYKYYKMTTGDLAKRFSHPLLRRFLVSLIPEEFGAIAFMFVVSTFCSDNGGIPQGGSLASAMRMAQLFKSLGGELMLKSEVVTLKATDGRITSATLSCGNEIRADYVIATCDPYTLFEKITDLPLPKCFEKDIKDRRLSRFSSFQCAFACDTDKLPFDADYIFELSQKHKYVLGIPQLIIREFTHEKTFAPTGKTVIQSLTFCNEDKSKEFIALRQNKALYNAKKQELAHAVQEAITEKFPALKGKIRLLDVWTPASYKRFTDTQIGSYMSYMFSSNVIPTKRNNRVKGAFNLILASQWQQFPGGLPIAANIGKNAAQTVEKLIAKRAKKVAPTLLPKPAKI